MHLTPFSCHHLRIAVAAFPSAPQRNHRTTTILAHLMQLFSSFDISCPVQIVHSWDTQRSACVHETNPNWFGLCIKYQSCQNQTEIANNFHETISQHAMASISMSLHYFPRTLAIGNSALHCLEYLNCIYTKKNFRSKALYCANVEPYCVQFWPLEFMECSDDQKIWGQQYLRYLYPWNVLFQFHPTHLNHMLANSSMP